MPSMSYEDDLPFHKTKSRAQLGVTADTFWRLPGVLRSDNNHAFAAVGQAERITAHTPLISHGLDSPVGRAYELDGQVLLLGVDHGSNTTIHLCENMAGVPAPARKIPHDPEGWSRSALNTAKSTTAVRISPWWMAGLMNADCKKAGRGR